MGTWRKAIGWVFAVTTVAVLAASPANAASARDPLGVTVIPATPNVSPPPVKTEKIRRGAGDGFRDCPDCPEVVVVPAGSFRMGDLSGTADRNEKPVRRVTIPDAFAVGKYEVIFTEWEACLSAAGCSQKVRPYCKERLSKRPKR